jgi:hypothetical protein
MNDFFILAQSSEYVLNVMLADVPEKKRKTIVNYSKKLMLESFRLGLMTGTGVAAASRHFQNRGGSGHREGSEAGRRQPDRR